MVSRLAIFLLPLGLVTLPAFAQDAPPLVDQALRARVTEFFQYHVDADFEKAYEMVAADTRKYYFGAQKIQFKSFKIDSIKYSDDWTKAVVTLTGERLMRMRIEFPETLVTVPMSTNWKVENGKWVWYHEDTDRWLTPMGPSDPEAVKRPSQAGKLDLSPEAIAARAQAILQQANGWNKSELKLAGDKTSADEVVFHNGQPGQIRLTLLQGDMPPGLTAKLDKSDIMGGQDGVLKVHYEPTPNASKPADVVLKLIMEPFNRTFTIPVKFD